MSDLYIDAVCLFTNPLVNGPEEALRLKVTEWIVRGFLEGCKPEKLSVKISRLRFLPRGKLASLFNIIDDVCRLVDIPASSLRVINDSEDVRMDEEGSRKGERYEGMINFDPAASDFERGMLDIFIPLINYEQHYSLYGLPCMDSVLICGKNSGKSFGHWFRELRAKFSQLDSTETERRLELHVIRFEDILSPYFGESEKRLVNMFEMAASRKGSGLTCICLEGIHHFTGNQDELDDLDHRLLTTLLLLLDGISKVDFISQHKKDLDNKSYHEGSLVVVATSERHPDKLPDALTRPGRLNKIIFV